MTMTMTSAYPIESEEKITQCNSQEFTIDESAPPFCPTHVFHVMTHSKFTKTIRVLNRTSILDRSHSDIVHPRIKDIMKLAQDTPIIDESAYLISRDSPFSREYTVTDGQGTVVAHWKHTMTSMGTALLTFPPGSAHSSHPIESKDLCWARRSKSFVKDSVTFSWEFESKVLMDKLDLFQIIGNRKVKIGRYEQSSKFGLTSGGTLVLDSRVLDELVGLLTCILVLKKSRQRAMEY